jgi:hypothetical protein
MSASLLAKTLLLSERKVEVRYMRVFWESMGVLGPIYRLVGKGLADAEIASTLNLSDLNVQSCIAWMLRFLKLTNREDLVLYASSAVSPIAAIEH